MLESLNHVQKEYLRHRFNQQQVYGECELVDAITAAQEYLAAPEQSEPFGYVIENNIKPGPYKYQFYLPSEIGTAYKDNAIVVTPVYTGAPQPTELEEANQVVANFEVAIKKADAEIERLKELLNEAAGGVEYYAGYAGEYLVKKHGILDDVKRYKDAARAALGEDRAN
jgi:hypothetical protein